MIDEGIPAELVAAFTPGEGGRDTERLRRVADEARQKMEALAAEIRDLVAPQPPLKLLSYLICHFHLAMMSGGFSVDQGSRPNKDVIKKFQFALEYVHAVWSCQAPLADEHLPLNDERAKALFDVLAGR